MEYWWQAALYFFAGIVCYIVLDKFLQTKNVIKLFHEVNFSILTMLKITYNKIMENKDKLTSNEMQTVEDWKNMSIMLFFVNYPQALHKFIDFNDWDSAMKWQKKESRKYEKV